ncbi:MAG: cysteine synthase A [Solirubrobacterales bacterium]
MDWNRNSRVLDNVLDAIGCTPIVRLSRLSQDVNAEILVKLEYTNPSGSLKDRILHRIIEAAEQRGELKPGMILLEGTTGNTGIATSMVGAAKGYRVIIVMPEGMTEERKKTIRAYGAELVLTPGGEVDVDLVLEEVQRIKAKLGDQVFQIGQFTRPENVDAHYHLTGPEIWEQTRGHVDAFVMCQGTGGTITGTGKYLKEKKTDVKVFVSEPLEAPILAECQIGPHKVQGIADGLVPEILGLEVIDGIVQISSDEAITMARRVTAEEGIFCGISSGINVAAALKLARHLPELGTIVTMINDNGLRYLSSELCGELKERKPANRVYQMPPEDEARIKACHFQVVR